MARANRRRLNAESIRDAMLAVANRLDFEAGGLTIRKIEQYDLGYQFDSSRRSVYVPCFRNSRLELFEMFDAANPNVVSGRRTTSTLPTQSLFMMNSPFVMQQAKAAASELLRQHSDLTPRQRIQHIFYETIGRQASTREIDLMMEYLEQADETDDVARWAGLYHLMFACLDFRYLD